MFDAFYLAADRRTLRRLCLDGISCGFRRAGQAIVARKAGRTLSADSDINALHSERLQTSMGGATIKFASHWHDTSVPFRGALAGAVPR
jgi:hypothetical protein